MSNLDILRLPTDETALSHVIEQHGYAAENNASTLWAKWSLFDLYLRGFRRFEAYDEKGGRVAHFTLDKDGRLPIQFQEVVVSLNRVLGTLRGISSAPLVSRVGDSLQAIRDRSYTQVMLDASLNPDHISEVHDEVTRLATIYGTAGVFNDAYADRQRGFTGLLEVVPPHELFPFPVTTRPNRVRAIQRTRVVSLDFLKGKFPNKRLSSRLKDMHSFKRMIHEDTDDGTRSSPPFSHSQSQPITFTSHSASTKDITEYAVKIREVFVYGPDNRMIRYACASKNCILQDIDYSKENGISYCPIALVRFLENSGFYGTSYLDILLSMTRTVEMMLKDLFNSVRDLRRYPVTLLPAGVLNEKTAFREDGQDGMRFLTITPEARFALAQQNIRPIVISPQPGSPEQAARSASFFMEILDRHAMVRDLVQDKGRIDSLPGLQFLEEVSRQPMTVPISNLNRAYSQTYRSHAAKLNSLALSADRSIPVSRLDLDLVGAVIDYDKSTVNLNPSALPDVTRLTFGMRGSTTASPTLKKQEAYLNQREGRISVDELRLYIAEEGIDAAMYTRGDRNAVRRITEDILRMYGDGETPPDQMVVPNVNTSRPHIQLIIMDAFMAGIEFQRASSPIQTLFIEYRKKLQRFAGNILPEGTPDSQAMALALAGGQ